MGIIEENRRLEELDKQYIWHPFTQMKEWLEEKPIIIFEGKDCFIKDIYGRWYLDGVSSLWVNIHGHRKKEIDDAIKKQLDKIAHSTLLGLSNVPAIKLAEKLVQIVQKSLPPHLPFTGNPPTPPLEKGGMGGLCKVFYSDNGSTAVEVALKMAFQYWRHKGVDGKNKFVSLNNAYHGDTMGAVSVGGIDIFHKAFTPLLFKTYKAPSPYCYRCELGKEYPECKFACLDKMEGIFNAHSGKIAALIIEPLIQAAGGMITSPPGYLKGVRELCTKYNILMIADEVATGFGRTGKMFACEHESAAPDIMCLSKGITGGYMPLAVTIATDDIYNAFLGEFKDLKTFFHGHSYTGNPLACAASLACLDLFEKEEVLKSLKKKIEILDTWLKEVLNLKYVGDVRNIGLMAGVELVRNKKTKKPYDWSEKMGWRVAYRARENGVFIRPLGNVIVIMPPLSISDQNLRQLLKVIKDSIVKVTES
ncbi:MAG: adenosylmethionine--8-amino-7-oxononanoate transaminase [Nitrospirae bacterium CG_4_10_14_0_8_um_filter_41_23]|nr:adenosylmethionine--8-amino-7-oxononanoate transaminase [Nitrospirota bacterium]OIP60826.1 MAG: adenosylmethionine--8-amino-7-oxononanoate transaminase [Nitrospirae bacterium CG2_30_41_42]PIQ94257.1 MAG: adenosylmethionine--8-amino-7-oxononanoate transaminase [Nitrospirae bacterium CG11_big_fil_rev_8_21_14_0_20_41_14]PIV43530.1 MAG: adenosylmethionine--8-amino-7-oxononanoate transaminase [Nitrospirae bacterium CG02_land_8_20_14_3_00_41_53]PIW87513.1 MAG: adenosylmethionine--8-amino-7-oxonona